MNRLFFSLFVFSVVVLSVNAGRPRSLTNFYTLIKKFTGRNPLDYNNYGNFCGLGGSGEPVDDVDKCCQTHDHCYTMLNDNECKKYIHLGPYFVMYDWEELNDGSISCEINKDECKKGICECDKTAAMCFAAHEYIPEHKN